jgi:hypothetical protein
MSGQDGSEKPAVINGAGTKVSLQLALRVALVLIVVIGAWADLKYEVRSLRRDLERGRWTKADDHLYMTELGRLNATLLLPEHKRAGP